jgi:hypothetical protein
MGFQNKGGPRERRREAGKGIAIREGLLKMQKELDMDLRVRITESQYEALKTVAEASGDTLDEYLHTSIIQAIQSDIDLYFGKSESIKEKLYKKIGANYG